MDEACIFLGVGRAPERMDPEQCTGGLPVLYAFFVLSCSLCQSANGRREGRDDVAKRWFPAPVPPLVSLVHETRVGRPTNDRFEHTHCGPHHPGVTCPDWRYMKCRNVTSCLSAIFPAGGSDRIKSHQRQKAREALRGCCAAKRRKLRLQPAAVKTRGQRKCVARLTEGKQVLWSPAVRGVDAILPMILAWPIAYEKSPKGLTKQLMPIAELGGRAQGPGRHAMDIMGVVLFAPGCNLSCMPPIRGSTES